MHQIFDFQFDFDYRSIDISDLKFFLKEKIIIVFVIKMDVSPSSTATAVTEDDPEREYLSEDSITERTDDQGTGYGFEPSMTSEQRLQRRQKRRKQLA